MSGISLDTTRFDRALRDFRRLSKLESKKLIEQQAKGFVKRVIAITPPASGQANAAAKRQGEAAILADCSRIFTPLPPATVASMLARAERRVLSRSQMGDWHASQRRAGGRVRNLAERDRAVVTQADFRAFVRGLQKQVGILASGWNAAARHLGLRPPAWISRHGNGSGSISVRVTSTGISVRMVNAVAFGPSVRSLPGRMQTALNYQANAMQRQTAAMLQRAGRHAGFRAR